MMRPLEYLHLLEDYEEWVGPREEVHGLVAYHGIDEGHRIALERIREALAKRNDPEHTLV